MSGTPDEEVDYGVDDIVENSHIVTDYEWNTQTNDYVTIKWTHLLKNKKLAVI